jgi:hypothetical protein
MVQKWTKIFDKLLLILQVVYEFYKQNNITEIRRARLKELCNDKLNERTGGQEDDYGGSFQRYLKELEGEGLLRCINIGKKHTIVASNIKKIEYFLLDRKLNQSYYEIHKISDEPFDEAWDKMIQEVYSSAIEKGIKLRYGSNSLDYDCAQKSHSLMKEYTAKSMANMMSSQLKQSWLRPSAVFSIFLSNKGSFQLWLMLISFGSYFCINVCILM